MCVLWAKISGEQLYYNYQNNFRLAFGKQLASNKAETLTKYQSKIIFNALRI